MNFLAKGETMITASKIFKLLLVSFVIILLATACKKDDSNPTESSSNPSEFVGTWKLTKITVTISGINNDLTPEQAGTQMTIIANNDASFKMTTITSDGTTTSEGTWQIANGKLILKYADNTSETYDYTLSGNKFSIKTSVEALGQTLPAVLEFTKQ